MEYAVGLTTNTTKRDSPPLKGMEMPEGNQPEGARCCGARVRTVARTRQELLSSVPESSLDPSIQQVSFYQPAW